MNSSGQHTFISSRNSRPLFSKLYLLIFLYFSSFARVLFLYYVCYFYAHHPLHHLSAISKCCVLPCLLSFWKEVMDGRKGGRKKKKKKKQPNNKTVLKGDAVQPVQQISIVLYAQSDHSYCVINWHVAVGQQCIALVRCPQCNKMQWKKRVGEWRRFLQIAILKQKPAEQYI